LSLLIEMITQKQWEAFAYVQQGGLALKQAAEKMEVEPREVAQLLKSLKAEQPDLFFRDSEYGRMCSQLRSDERPDLYHYEPGRDDEQVKRAF